MTQRFVRRACGQQFRQFDEITFCDDGPVISHIHERHRVKIHGRPFIGLDLGPAIRKNRISTSQAEPPSNSCPDSVEDIWRRLAAVMSEFQANRYVAELHLSSIQTPVIRAFRLVLSAFVRGRVYLHYATEAEAERALAAAGFTDVSIELATDLAPERGGSGSRLVHIIEASTV